MLEIIFKKLFKIANLVICYQFIASPIVYANGTLTGIGMASSAIQTALNAYQQASSGQNYNAYKARFSSELGLSVVDPSEIPAALNSCIVLGSAASELSSGETCSGAMESGIRVNDGYSAALIEVAEQNIKTIKNYTTEGHARYSSQGIGCYNKKLQDFENQLKARETQIDAYVANLDKMLDEFNLANKSVLNAIKQKNAILNGGSDQNADEFLKDYDFEGLLMGTNGSTNACGTILASGTLQETGEKSGLRGMLDSVTEVRNGSSNNTKNMSAPDLLSKIKTINNDIDSLAEKISSQMENAESSEASIDSISYRGGTIAKDNSALNEILTEFNTSTKNNLDSIAKTTSVSASIEGAGNLSSLKSQYDSGSLSLDDLNQALNSYEKITKNACLTSAFSSAGFNDATTFASKFKNPNISKSLQESGDNSMAAEVSSILRRNDLTIDEKLKKVQSIQNSNGNSNYVLTLGKTVTIGDVKFNASTPLQPADLVEVLVDTCNTNYSAQNPNNSSGYSQAQAVANLKSYATKRSQLLKTAYAQVKAEIKTELKTCPSDTSTGVSSNSCSNALNLDSASFCVKTATLCAKNMNTCKEAADRLVNQVATAQKTEIALYNNSVDALRTSLKKQITEIANYFNTTSLQIEAQMDVADEYKIPEINFQISEDNYQTKDIDSDLKVLDPEAYITSMKESLNSQKAALQNQRTGLVAQMNNQIQTYESNYSSQMADWQKIISDCTSAQTAELQNEAKQDEKIAENNTTIAEGCQNLQAFQANPTEGSAEDLADTLGKVIQLSAATPIGQAYGTMDQQQLAQIRALASNSSCGGDVDEEENSYMPPTSKTSGKLTVASFCENDDAMSTWGDDEKRNLKEMCTEYALNQGGVSCNSEEKLASIVQAKQKEKLFLKAGGNEVITCNATEIKPESCGGISIGETGLDTDKESHRLLIANYLTKKYQRDDLPEEYECALSNKQSKSERKQLISQLKMAVKGYNCSLDMKAAGSLQIAACNSTMATMGLNLKGSLEALAGAAGSAIGAGATGN